VGALFLYQDADFDFEFPAFDFERLFNISNLRESRRFA
jgi:hypothetical protein